VVSSNVLEGTFMSVASQSRSKQAYKEMSYTLYLVVTLVSYFICMALSIIVNDIGIIFQIISAVSYSNFGFICPGLFFLVARRKYGTPEQKEAAK
jgi:hypothetical protein